MCTSINILEWSRIFPLNSSNMLFTSFLSSQVLVFLVVVNDLNLIVAGSIDCLVMPTSP